MMNTLKTLGHLKYEIADVKHYVFDNNCDDSYLPKTMCALTNSLVITIT